VDYEETWPTEGFCAMVEKILQRNIENKDSNYIQILLLTTRTLVISVATKHVENVLRQ